MVDVMDNTAPSPAAPLEQIRQAKADGGIPDYLAVDDIAAKIKASKQFVYKLIDAGDLECDRFGTLLRISPAQFQAYRDRQSKKSPEAA